MSIALRLPFAGAPRSAARPNQVVPEFEPWRARLVLLGFALLLLTLVARAFYLQVFDHDFLISEGTKRHIRTLTVPGGRGAILDRNGTPLALSAPVESVWAVPAELLGAREQLPKLAKLLGLNPRELKKHLEARADKGFLYLKRQMNPGDAARVLALGLPGVFTQREYRRYYPAGEAAAQLVGLTDIDMNGQEGLELALEAQLRGEDGSRRVIKDRVGRVVEDLEQYRQPQPGADVRLSIDLRLQHLAYRELKSAVIEQRAEGGVVVLLDPHNGEVLALASDPSFNPNRREAVEPAAMRQRAVTDLFEPGSTIKPLVVGAGIEAGLYRPSSVISTEHGRWRVGRLLVKDVHDYGDVDLTTLLMKSSNVGAAKIGMQLGAQRLWQAYRGYGIGQPTGSDFPGEVQGVLRPAKQWGQIATATSSYGYGFSLNALQLARAYSALAADGLLPAVTLVKRDGQVLAERPRALSVSTARELRRMLETVISPKGTARRAAVEGYRIAGKTGTVHKVAPGGGYLGRSYQSLFVGMVPAERPRLVAVIMIDEPNAGQHYGGAVAAPVFAKIMQRALRAMRVPPEMPVSTVTAAKPLPPEARI
ncbi:MAG: peptidoglycan D,D-transpeptidase FtsI family protein [Nevskiales bacterium]